MLDRFTVDYDLDTPSYLRHGITLFQSEWVDGNPEKTIDAIHDALGLTQATILDAGCGVGAVAVGMTARDPSLRFVCLSNSALQVRIVDDLRARFPNITGLLGDFHHMPLPDASVDGAMFNESFGYGDQRALFREAARVLKPGGRLVLKDLFRKPGIPWEDYVDVFGIWGYVVHDPQTNIEAAHDAGLRWVSTFPLATSNDHYRDFRMNDLWMRVRYGLSFDGPYPDCAIQVFQK